MSWNLAEEGAFQPVDGATVDGKHVKAAARFSAMEIDTLDLRKKPRCSGQQPPLFTGIYAGRRAAMAAIAALADFHEDKFLAVAHDEVDFSGAALQVARQQSQPGGLQVRQGEIFRAVAELAGRPVLRGWAGWRVRRGVWRGRRYGAAVSGVLPCQPPLAVAPRALLRLFDLLPDRGVRGAAENSILAG